MKGKSISLFGKKGKKGLGNLTDPNARDPGEFKKGGKVMKAHGGMPKKRLDKKSRFAEKFTKKEG